MLETVLRLELLLQEPSIDLAVVSELVLSDVGATIQILRLIGNNLIMAGAPPRRMYECLASLEVSTWFEVISAHAVSQDQNSPAAIALWKHSRLIAELAKRIAEPRTDIYPEDAYLVGLLHEVATIPAALDSGNALVGETMHQELDTVEGSVLWFAILALQGKRVSTHLSTWQPILSKAHLLADEASGVIGPFECAHYVKGNRLVSEVA
jgi:hypothetical protein